MHADLGFGRPLDAHAERAQRPERRQTILAREKALDLRARPRRCRRASVRDARWTCRPAAAARRALRWRGHATLRLGVRSAGVRRGALIGDAQCAQAPGALTQRREQSIVLLGQADRDAQILAESVVGHRTHDDAAAAAALIDLRAPALPRSTSRKLPADGAAPQPERAERRSHAIELAQRRCRPRDACAPDRPAPPPRRPARHVLTLNAGRTPIEQARRSRDARARSRRASRPARTPWKRCAPRPDSGCSSEPGDAHPACRARARTRGRPHRAQPGCCAGARSSSRLTAAGSAQVPVGLLGLAMKTRRVSARDRRGHRRQIVTERHRAVARERRHFDGARAGACDHDAVDRKAVLRVHRACAAVRKAVGQQQQQLVGAVADRRCTRARCAGVAPAPP